MVYLFALIALLALAVKGYCGKKVSLYVRDTGDSFLFNIVRLLLCMGIGLAVILVGGGADFGIEGGMIAICALSGVSNAAFLAGWMLAICRNSMVMVDVGLTIGSILPAVLCSVLFGEEFSWLRMIGFALILAAVLILAGYNRQAKGKVGFFGVLMLVIAAVGDGLTGFGQQLYKQFYTESGGLTHGVFYDKSVYNFYIYLFAALTLAIIYVVYGFAHRRERARSSVRERLRGILPPLPFIFVMAVCLFAATYFQTVCTGDYGMPSQILYPLMKGGCLILVNFTAMLFFGEKMTWRSIAGSAVALAGIVLLNIL